MGVWNGWGYGIAFFRALKFQISEPEKIWQKSLFLQNFGDFLQISASEKYFSDSGKWPFHTPPIHTPTKCRPKSCFGFALADRGHTYTCALLHAPSSGLFRATDLATRVGLALVSVGLASV